MDKVESNKKVIVTGVSGQDGSYMVDYLLKKTDATVYAAVRRTSQAIDSHYRNHLGNPRFHLIHFDLIDPYSVESMVIAIKPDYFINFAAQTFVADSWKMPQLHNQCNASGVLSILEAIRNHCPSCRFYNAGTSEQFGDVVTVPQNESHPFRPRSPYGAAKCSAHLYVKTYRDSFNLYAVQGILFNHESERRQDYFVTRKITKYVAAYTANKEIPPLELGNTMAKRDWSHAYDFVDGVWRMLHQPELRGDGCVIKDYVLSSNETHTVEEFVSLAFKAAGIDVEFSGSGLDRVAKTSDGKVVMKVNPEFYRPAEVEILFGDSSKAREQLMWKPSVSFEELVKKMVLNDIELIRS